MSEIPPEAKQAPNAARNRVLSSGNSMDDSRTSPRQVPNNPFENTNVKSYSHRPNIIPPYVLDKLSQAHYKEQLNNSNVNHHPDTRQSLKTSHSQKDDDEQFLSFANDPFVRSMNSNWHNLLHSVKQRTAYAPGVEKVDQDFNAEWKLDGSWGGEDRLKLALLGTSSSDEDPFTSDEVGGCFGSILFTLGMKKSKKSASDVAKLKDHDHPKVRSKAGYWMSDEKRADVVPMLSRVFVQNPLVPLFLRILIIIFSTAALALACSIYVFSRHKYDGRAIEQQPSTIMAVVVQCCAIVYVIYIAYDEYSGKPLGLRNPLGKMKLIMLDLLFIIFSSANLSLTFNTLYDDEWVCQRETRLDLANLGIFYPTVHSICRRQRALAAFLFLVLCLWVVTFTISIVRVVDRVSSASPRSD